MHLKNITLENFRCFDRLSVPLHPRLTVLVAENGGGKTSVLDGISLGLSPALRALSSANQRLPGPGIEDTDFRLLTTPAGKTEVRADYVQIILETTDKQKWDVWKGVMKGASPPVKYGQAALQRLTDILLSYKTDSPELLPIFAYYGARRGWIDIPQRIRQNKYKAVDYGYPTSALYGCLDALTDFKEMMKWFDTEEAGEIRRQRDSEDYEGSRVLDCVREAIPYVLGDSYYQPHFDGRHKFMIKSKKGPALLRVSQLSQGYQSMLALVMDFSRRLALGNSQFATYHASAASITNRAIEYARHWDEISADDAFIWLTRGPVLAPAIMLVDEIDLHLHPSWQQNVLHDLMAAFPHTQFIVTTHSPQVLTTVKRENIRILAQDEDGIWSADMPKEETKGVESSLAMNDVMGVNQIPPVPEAGWRNDYTALIESGKHDSPEGTELRDKLVALYGAQHPIILDFDRLIRFQAFKTKQAKRD
jgi:predicted ATP-binding protein involved in virulence